MIVEATKALSPATRALAEPIESTYLQYLPGIYRQDPFMGRFLLILESVWGPLERLVDHLPLYTDPSFTPREFMPWLAHWVCVSLDNRWPTDRQRALIGAAVEIYRWRGSRRGLALHIASYSGVEPVIQEHQSGFILGRDSALGWTTRLDPKSSQHDFFTVTVPSPRPESLDEGVIRAIIEEDKPAHTTYALRIVRCLPEAALERRQAPR